MSDGWGRAKKDAKKEDPDKIRKREGDVQRRTARAKPKKRKARATKGMTKTQAAKAYEAVAAELDRLQSAASNHISRTDNNWVFERVYSFRYIAERIRREYEVGEYEGGGPHAERLGSRERAELTRLRLAEQDRIRAEHAASSADVVHFTTKTPTDAEIEAEIQESFASEREPAPDDLEGWKRRSGHWQAAWAGAYKRAAQSSVLLEAEHPSGVVVGVGFRPFEQPLVAEVREGRLVISIGVKTLAHATEVYMRDLVPIDEPPDSLPGASRSGISVTDPTDFAHEVVRALLREDESGETTVTRMLDDATVRAIDDGAEGVAYSPAKAGA